MSDFATAPLVEAGWQPGRVLEELAFVYLPSDDVAAELPLYVDHLGAEVVWYERTRPDRAASIVGRRDF